MITELVTDAGPSLGSWEIQLVDQTPDAVLDQLGFFGHVAVVDGRVDVEATGDALLPAARYVGVMRARATDRRKLSGEGVVYWLGDEDDKGPVLETELKWTGAPGDTLAAVITALLPPAVTVGTIHPQPNPAQRYAGAHRFQTRRKAVALVCAAFGVEFRVNGDFTIDVGTQAQLYQGVPRTDGRLAPIIRRTPGADVDYVAIAGTTEVDEAVRDYSRRVVLIGQTDAGGEFATGAAETPTSYLDPRGNPLQATRLISESDQPVGSVTARAQLHLNRFARVVRTLRLTADEYESEGTFRAGDLVYVFDPETGITNPNNPVDFRGELIHPDVIRVAGMAWPVAQGMTVAFRTMAGTWLDLTDYVTPETGGGEITVGDLPKSLTGPSDSTIPDRVDANAGKGDTPNPPTGLALQTDSVIDPSTGASSSIVRAAWSPPTANTDSTALTDLSHYLVQWRPSFRAPLWTSTATPLTTIDLPAVVGLDYDVRVAAVDKSNNQSDWTSVATITAAADMAAPPAPSDPVLEPYFGLLRVRWNGLTAAGQPMPEDFNRVDVHISSVSGFTPSAATLAASASAGGIVGHVNAPYGATRYVKLVAYDHAQNPSQPSGQASGATVQVADGDIASLAVGKLTAGVMLADVTIAGRFTTALTGARTELNALGLQKFAADNSLLVSITGTEALLTGVYKTALIGRRIELGAGGLVGEMNFFAPDGKKAQIRAYTEAGGVEAIQFGIPVGTHTLWNRINYNSSPGGEYATYKSGTHEFAFDTTAPNEDFDGFVVWSTTNRAQSGAGVRRFAVQKDDKFFFGIDTGEFMQLETNGNPSQGSILIQGFTGIASNGLIYGGSWRFSMGQPGVSVGWDARYFDDSVYIPVRASSFDVQSSAAEKTDIAELTGSALEIVGRMRPKKYRRKGPTVSAIRVSEEPAGPDGRRSRRVVENVTDPLLEQREQIGLIAEEAPAEVVVPVGPDGLGVDLYAMASLTAAGLNELAARVNLLEKVRMP